MAMQIRKINTDTRQTVNIVALSALGATDARAMDVSANGTLYVADAGRDVVIKVYENGTISGAVVGHISTAGNVNADGITKTGNDARLNVPVSICVDKSDYIYVGDGNGTGFQIRRMSPSGVISFFAGNYAFNGDVINQLDGDTDNTKSRFNPFTTGMGMVADRAGVIYLCDSGNHKIKKLWHDGRTVLLAGNGIGGMINDSGARAEFNRPLDCCVDQSGNVFVADSVNNRIRKIADSGLTSTLVGGAGSGFTNGDGATAQLNDPIRICMDPSNQFMYVMDKNNSAIRKVQNDGFTTTFCHYNVPAGNSTGDICVDASGFLYILENNS